MSSSFLKTSSDFWYPQGISSSSGFSFSYHCRHSFSLFSICKFLTPSSTDQFLVRSYLTYPSENVVKHLQFAYFDQIQPSDVQNPAERLWLDRVEIEGCPAFYERQELFVSDESLMYVDLHREHEGE